MTHTKLIYVDYTRLRPDLSTRMKLLRLKTGAIIHRLGAQQQMLTVSARLSEVSVVASSCAGTTAWPRPRTQAEKPEMGDSEEETRTAN